MSAHNACCCVRSKGTAAGDKGGPSRYGESDRFAGALVHEVMPLTGNNEDLSIYGTDVTEFT